MAKFAWIVEIELAEDLVADGFQITERVMADVFSTALPYVRASAVQARVLSAPDPDAIARAQGFASAADKAAREVTKQERRERTTARLHRR